MANILAFGDSNTWGLVPGNKGRYPWGVRWTSIVQENLKQVNLIEDGLCGRTTVFEDRERPHLRGTELLPISLEKNYPLDGAVIMLGTNDCKSFYGADPKTIGEGLEKCLDELEKYIEPQNILVIPRNGITMLMEKSIPEILRFLTSADMKNPPAMPTIT